ncbi:MAG: cupin domain-containing protein, partial [Mycobacteriales bacterium]
MRLLTDAGSYRCPPGTPNHFVEHLREPALSVGTYCVPRGGEDDQLPHGQDEVYVVMSGAATLRSGGESVAVGAGSVVFVPAGEAHRFVDVTEDLALLVLFAPA